MKGCPAQAPQDMAPGSYRYHRCFLRGRTGRSWPRSPKLKSPVCEQSSPSPGPTLRGSRGIGAELPPHRHGQLAAGTGTCGGLGMSVKASGGLAAKYCGAAAPTGTAPLLPREAALRSTAEAGHDQAAPET